MALYPVHKYKDTLFFTLKRKYINFKSQGRLSILFHITSIGRLSFY